MTLLKVSSLGIIL